MKLLKDKELFLFDFDGTLVDTGQDILSSVNHVRQHYDLPPLTFAQANIYIGIGLKKLVEGVLSELPSVDIEEACNIYKEHHQKHLTDHARFYPDVPELLINLKKQNKKIGIVTNKYSFFAKQILEKLDCPVEFNIILGADNSRGKKPEAIPILQACETLNVKPKDTVMIGDSVYDIQAGKKAGVATVAYLHGFGVQKVLAEQKPDFQIAKFSELF